MIHKTPTQPVLMFVAILSVMGLIPVPEGSEQAVIEVTVREGTNMAAALSPDGRTIASGCVDQTIGINPKFRELKLGLNLGFHEVATHRLGNVLHFRLSPTQLQSIIAVSLFCAGLNDLYIIKLQHGDRHMFTTVYKPAGHPLLLRN